MNPQWFKVGELASASGVSVRSLHHYDEIGLLSPSRRSDAGHRLYGPDDVARLQRVVSLKQLGFSLDEIRTCLTDPSFSPRAVLARHLDALDRRIDAQRQLRERLADLARQLDGDLEVSTADFLQTIQEIQMVEQHFTPEQREQLAERKKQIGAERIRQVEREWPQLIAEVRTHMERGTAPDNPVMQGLAQRWKALVDEFTGGDPGIEAGVAKVYRNEPEVRQKTGLDAEIMQFVGRAMDSLR